MWKLCGRALRIAIPSLPVLLAFAGSAHAQTIDETAIPTGSSNALLIVHGPDGALWFTESGANQIGRIDMDKSVTEFPIPTLTTAPFGIAAGPDGNLWFTENSNNKVGRITPAGVVTEFPLTAGTKSPAGIAAGPDGNLWFVEPVSNQIARITPAGMITEFTIPTSGAGPFGIAAGADGALWFTETVTAQIGRITTAGVITEFPVPTNGSVPFTIAPGSDGNLWFTEMAASRIGRITPAGVVKEFPTPTASSGPAGIAAAPDGGLWFTEEDANQIGRIGPSGVITETPLPTAASGPRGITWGPDGSLWIVESAGNRIARALIGLFPTPTPTSSPIAITGGPDGNVWFAECFEGNNIGRVTPLGAITEFPLPSSSSWPDGIGAGPDGNLWFCEAGKPVIGRITTAGAITEFLTTGVTGDVKTGPDGNLWFSEFASSRIGRITPAGDLMEFPTPTPASEPSAIVSGPDGALWFTEFTGNNIGRVTTSGSFTEFAVPTAEAHPGGIALGFDGNLWFTESSSQNGRITTSGVITELTGITGKEMTLGPDGNLWIASSWDLVRLTTAGGTTSFPGPSPHQGEARGVASGPDGNLWFCRFGWSEIVRLTPPRVPDSLIISADTSGNGVVEPGETFTVSPRWRNWTSTIALAGTVSGFTGPGIGTYNVVQASADYGTAAPATPVDCASATGSCYQLTVSDPGSRPQQHWDAHFDEFLDSGEQKTWKLHVGASFTDVAPASGPYRFVETIFHNGITGGCAVGVYCPTDAVSRAQIAVFLMVAEHKSGYHPPPCTSPAFSDVPCSSGFAPFINQLVAESVTAGCGGGNYCPSDSVTRAQMAVFLLRTKEGATYTPPACVTPTFSDVPCSSGFAPWIEELVRRGVTAGCGGGDYCPGTPVTRGQMAVFLTTTFGLSLYGPEA